MIYWEIKRPPDLYNAVIAQDKFLVEKLLANGIKDELWNYSDVEYHWTLDKFEAPKGLTAYKKG
jgi:hypothetical protein